MDGLDGVKKQPLIKKDEDHFNAIPNPVFEGVRLSSGATVIVDTKGSDFVHLFQLIIVHVPEGMEPPSAGSLVSYTVLPGMMKSYPPQARALRMEVLAEDGGVIPLCIEAARRIFEQEPSETLLVDVRSLDECDDNHLEGARHVLVERVREMISEENRQKTWIVYSHSGKRSSEAAGILKEAGIRVVFDAGGLDKEENENECGESRDLRVQEKHNG